MLHQGRFLFYLLAAGLVAALALTLGRLPPIVASHFDAAGAPNGWSTRPVYALVLVGIGILLPLATVGLITRLTRDGPASLNIPARDYWTRPEHAGRAVALVRAYHWWLGAILAGTSLAIHALVLAAHGRVPPRLSSSAMVGVLVTVTLAIGGWAVGWYRLLRRPTEGRRGGSA
jgi:hypothetical protein